MIMYEEFQSLFSWKSLSIPAHRNYKNHETWFQSLFSWKSLSINMSS